MLKHDKLHLCDYVKQCLELKCKMCFFYTVWGRERQLAFMNLSGEISSRPILLVCDHSPCICGRAVLHVVCNRHNFNWVYKVGRLLQVFI